MKVFLLATLLLLTSLPAFAMEKETTYERVMRTGVLRCAYISYRPSIEVDPATGEISGIFYDLVTEMGKLLKLKVEWTEEVGYGAIIEGFKTGRYDMFCAAVSPTPERARASVFTLPLYYSPIGVWVRADDTRFDNDYRLLNDERFRISIKDGDLQESIADVDFPHAKKIAIPPMADTSQNLQDVVAGKADATFVEPYYAGLMLDKNPYTLKNVASSDPVRFFANVMMLPEQEFQMKMLIDTVLQEMLNRGVIDDLVKKHTGWKDTYLAVAKPYERAK